LGSNQFCTIEIHLNQYTVYISYMWILSWNQWYLWVDSSIYVPVQHRNRRCYNELYK